MAKYAEKTSVPASQSRAEIERTLERYGAEGFAYAWQDTKTLIGFSMHGRQVRFTLILPAKDSEEFTRTPGRRSVRSADQKLAAYEKAVRQRWRALALVIKAKLEAVEAGITVFEEEFLAHMVLPNGKTVGAAVIPEIETAYKTGKVKGFLPLFETEGRE